jgi:hypothetical protein
LIAIPPDANAGFGKDWTQNVGAMSGAVHPAFDGGFDQVVGVSAAVQVFAHQLKRKAGIMHPLYGVLAGWIFVVKKVLRRHLLTVTAGNLSQGFIALQWRQAVLLTDLIDPLSCASFQFQ